LCLLLLLAACDDTSSGAAGDAGCPSPAGAPCCEAPEVSCPAGYTARVQKWAGTDQVSYKGCMNARNQGIGPFVEYDEMGNVTRFGTCEREHVYCDTAGRYANYTARVHLGGGQPRTDCIEGCWDATGVAVGCGMYSTGAPTCDADGGVSP